MKKISIFSSCLGTLIEVYDFSIFAFLIPVLSEVFFYSYSKSEALTFTVLAYIVSYVIKPFSTLAMGCLIDRYRRKSVLLYTTILMVIATTFISLLPIGEGETYTWTILICCRVMQGIAISGEFSTAIIMSVEASEIRPAFSGCMAFFGGILGLLLANLTAFILLYVMSHTELIDYGWRIPFLISTCCGLFLFLVRNRITDLPNWNDNKGFNLRSLLKKRKKELITIFLISSLSASAFYITFVFMPTWFTATLGLHNHKQSLLITMIALCTYLFALPLAGFLADRVGVIKQIKVSSLFYLFTSYLVFLKLPYLDEKSCIKILILFALIQASLNSALPAFMVNQFHPRERGKALALSYNMSLTIFGAVIPYLMLTQKINLNPGVPISICALASFLVLQLYK